MPKLRGKQADFKMGPEHRLKIANSNILKCLIDHVSGKREMSATQVTAGLGLLRKVMPDLSNVELNGNVTHDYAMVPEVARSNDEWLKEAQQRIN